MSHEQGRGVGSGKKGGGQSLERGNCVRLGSARRSTGSSQEGTPSPGPLPEGRRVVGGRWGSGRSRHRDGGAWAVADWQREEGTSGQLALGDGELSALE